jgi:Ribbon-helix-helix domain
MERHPTERQNLHMLREHMTALRAMSVKTGMPIVRLIRKAVAEFLERNK